MEFVDLEWNLRRGKMEYDVWVFITRLLSPTLTV